MSHFHTITPRQIKLSAAFKVIDTFTDEAPITEPIFELNGSLHKSYKHAQSGYWSMTELQPGTYKMEVRARNYFPTEMEFELGFEPIRMTVPLEPKPYYPYPPGTTIQGLVEGPVLTDPLNDLVILEPLGDVEIRARYVKLGSRLNEVVEIATATTLTDNRRQYDGRYTLFLRNVNPKEEVSLTFKKVNYEDASATVQVKEMEMVTHNQRMALSLSRETR